MIAATCRLAGETTQLFLSLPDTSFKQIGRALNKNHPSVSNAIKVVERRILERAPLRYQVEAISRRIEQVRTKRSAEMAQ